MSGKFGKWVGQTQYIHRSALNCLSPEEQEFVRAENNKLTDSLFLWNVVKIDHQQPVLSFLEYENFETVAFPALLKSCTIDLQNGQIQKRVYQQENPPILHRKELLLPPDHARKAEFEQLTHQLESAGLFEDVKIIGHRQNWFRLIHQSGFRLQGHQLVTIDSVSGKDPNARVYEEEPTSETSGTSTISEPGNSDDDSPAEIIERHRTAIQRGQLSTPMQALFRNGFLDGTRTVFDYGCGRGDDLRGLQHLGIEATGWDPHFAPERPKTEADVVNLGFVINVIENPDERVEVLRSAFELAHECLAVAVMLERQAGDAAREYGDGVVSSRQTFQKYFTQTELREWLESTLGRNAFAVAPGVFFVFRDDEAEQRYLSEKQRNRGSVQHLLENIPQPSRQDKLQSVYEQHKSMIDMFWSRLLFLGRAPLPDEIQDLEPLIEQLGGLKKSLKLLMDLFGQETFDIAARLRKSDLMVFLALLAFEKRKGYGEFEPLIQRDIKAFFGGYQKAMDTARALLFSIADTQQIAKACQLVADQEIGVFDPGKSLQLHVSHLDDLPAILRIYVGCATRLYGDIQTADLVKIHIQSGKLSLLSFDRFEESPLPRMMLRIKINMQTQSWDIFEYGFEFPPPLLYGKSLYMDETFPHYEEQIQFDEALMEQVLPSIKGYGPSEEEFQQLLRKARLRVEGFSLVRSNDLPGLDDPCGANFSYRDLIECGETQARTELPNLPQSPETYWALEEMAEKILDPVIDYFGPIELTFGFCSKKLATEIKKSIGRIDPKLDQHAGHETNTKGEPVCSRLGAAVDFRVEDESMKEVAQWVIENTSFDRLYYYGDDRPIHVSIGPENTRQVVVMLPRKDGKLVPKVLKDPMALDEY
ncbi:MAG: DNA phosphorothioation-associated putative methyltransferase [SAR324 cluster bacterium]|nr:DNA phosphorothioation-associated putative methyltransferase [SAR324 cluster bacterium]